MSTEIQEYSSTEAALGGLRDKYKGVVYDVSTKVGMESAKVARKEISGYRVALEKKRVEIKAPALERCRLIDAEAKRLTTELLLLESPLDHTITTEEKRVEKERQERIQAENDRKQGIANKIGRFRGVTAAMSAPTLTSVQIQKTLTKVIDAVVDEAGYNEFLQEALEARAQAVESLTQLVADVVAREEEQARILAERAELEELRRQNVERLEREEQERQRLQHEQDETLRKEREAQEAELQKQRAAQDEVLRKEREQAEQLRLKEEQDRRDHQEKVESADRLRLAKEANTRREQEAQAAELRRQQDELDRQKKEQLDREAAHLAHMKKLHAAKKDSPEAALASIVEICKSERGWDDLTSCIFSRDQIAIIAEANTPEPPPAKKTARTKK